MSADVLARAISDGMGAGWEASRPAARDAALGMARAVLFALDAAGWTIASKQDAADGETLRRLVESLPDGWWVSLSSGPRWYLSTWALGVLAGQDIHADSIADAADAARRALEAGR